jgi:hypothetical protein
VDDITSSYAEWVGTGCRPKVRLRPPSGQVCWHWL